MVTQNWGDQYEVQQGSLPPLASLGRPFFPQSFVFVQYFFFFCKSSHIIHYFELRSMFFYCRWKKTFYQGIFSQNVRNMNFYRVTNIVPLVKTLESTSFVEFAFYCFLFSLRLWEMCKVLFCKVIVSKAPSTYYTIQKSEILTPTSLFPPFFRQKSKISGFRMNE